MSISTVIMTIMLSGQPNMAYLKPRDANVPVLPSQKKQDENIFRQYIARLDWLNNYNKKSFLSPKDNLVKPSNKTKPNYVHKNSTNLHPKIRNFGREKSTLVKPEDCLSF